MVFLIIRGQVGCKHFSLIIEYGSVKDTICPKLKTGQLYLSQWAIVSWELYSVTKQSRERASYEIRQVLHRSKTNNKID